MRIFIVDYQAKFKKLENQVLVLPQEAIINYLFQF